MKTQFMTRFLDPGTDGAGGGTDTPPAKQPTLADLTDPNYKPVTDVDDAAQKAAADAQAAQAALDAEATNEDGSLKEGYIKGDDGKITKDPNHKPADGDGTDPNGDNDGADDNTGDNDGNEDPAAFWADVDKLRGEPIEVTYPDGVDPLSPEGVYHREKVVEQKAIEKFEDYLKKSDPRAYAYMLHRQAGGDDEIFFSNKTFSLPEYDTFKDSVDLQARLYKSSLLNKGLDEDTAQMAVDKAIKDGALFTKADAEYKSAVKSQEQELAEIESQRQLAEQNYTKNVNQFSQTLSTAITEGKGMKFIIPDTDKANFLSFVKEHVEYDGSQGKFLLVQRVENETLTQQLESLYFLYKKGDLNGLIKNQAQTQTVKRLKRAVDASKGKTTPGADDSKKGTGGFVPLGSL